jgi:hypothetical protein
MIVADGAEMADDDAAGLIGTGAAKMTGADAIGMSDSDRNGFGTDRKLGSGIMKINWSGTGSKTASNVGGIISSEIDGWIDSGFTSSISSLSSMLGSRTLGSGISNCSMSVSGMTDSCSGRNGFGSTGYIPTASVTRDFSSSWFGLKMASSSALSLNC